MSKRTTRPRRAPGPGGQRASEPRHRTRPQADRGGEVASHERELAESHRGRKGRRKNRGGAAGDCVIGRRGVRRPSCNRPRPTAMKFVSGARSRSARRWTHPDVSDRRRRRGRSRGRKRSPMFRRLPARSSARKSATQAGRPERSRDSRGSRPSEAARLCPFAGHALRAGALPRRRSQNFSPLAIRARNRELCGRLDSACLNAGTGKETT